MNLDHDLLRAFKRKPAPSDLADRVLARLSHGDDRRARAVWPARPAARWLAAAAATALAAIGGAQYYSHHARQHTIAEAERVQNDVRLALQIAGEQLALVQRRLQEPHR